MDAPIAAAVDAAVIRREPLPVKASRLKQAWDRLRAAVTMPAQPALDEPSIHAAIRHDAQRHASTVDENTVPYPLPAQSVAHQVLGLTAILGTQARYALASVEKQAASMIAMARTAKALSRGLVVMLWLVLLVIETIAVKPPLADMFAITDQVMAWVAAAAVSVLAAIAGLALAWSWFHSLVPDDDDPEGMVGRSMVRFAKIAVLVTLLMFVSGLIWGRVLYAADLDRGLDAATVNAEPAHALTIGGLVLLSAAVSFAIKALQQGMDSRTRLRLDVGLQRTRAKAVDTLESAFKVIEAYIDLETRARVLAQSAPGEWDVAFHDALQPDARDHWTAYQQEQGSTVVAEFPESAWVADVRKQMLELKARVRSLALPVIDQVADPIATIDIRDSQDDHI